MNTYTFTYVGVENVPKMSWEAFAIVNCDCVGKRIDYGVYEYCTSSYEPNLTNSYPITGPMPLLNGAQTTATLY